MRRVIALCGLFLAWSGTICSAEGASENRQVFPRHWLRGYLDLELAPPHHEVDLGLCLTPGCSGYARYQWSAYVEAQPFARGLLKSGFVFAEPKLYGGNNVPQAQYTASAALIAWEREAGVGWVLPRGFELRLTQHQTFLLGRFTRAAAPPVRPDGPYGANMRVGVRWNFGGWGSSSR